MVVSRNLAAFLRKSLFYVEIAQTVMWHLQIRNKQPQNRGVVYFDFKLGPQCRTWTVERPKGGVLSGILKRISLVSSQGTPTLLAFHHPSSTLWTHPEIKVYQPPILRSLVPNLWVPHHGMGIS